MRTRPCTDAIRMGRLSKAISFYTAAKRTYALAQTEPDSVDSAATLFVQAGIAASDVLCCVQLKMHARGQDHADAVGLLARVSKPLASDLRTLLELKSPVAYSHERTSKAKLDRAARAAARLVEAASDVR